MTVKFSKFAGKDFDFHIVISDCIEHHQYSYHLTFLLMQSGPIRGKKRVSKPLVV
jgi:hypothetical protein